MQGAFQWRASGQAQVGKDLRANIPRWVDRTIVGVNQAELAERAVRRLLPDAAMFAQPHHL
jgi:hypothetical protein